MMAITVSVSQYYSYLFLINKEINKLKTLIMHTIIICVVGEKLLNLNFDAFLLVLVLQI